MRDLSLLYVSEAENQTTRSGGYRQLKELPQSLHQSWRVQRRLAVTDYERKAYNESIYRILCYSAIVWAQSQCTGEIASLYTLCIEAGLTIKNGHEALD